MQANLMEYNIKQLLAKAIMQKKALIIVEGEDDRPFYLRITEYVGKKADVKASEVVRKPDGSYYGAGCTGVIDIVENLQPEIHKNPLCKKYFLGIIDSDYRRYKPDKNIEEIECLFVLKYYSYESHFITDNTIKQLITHTTRVAMQDVTDEIIAKTKERLPKAMNDIYYAGLAYLRAVDGDPDNNTVKRIYNAEELYQKEGNTTKIDKILKQKEELEQFANKMNISQKDILFVVKGKYLLYAFVQSVYGQIGILSSMCRSGQIEQCDYCKNGKTGHCIWKVKNQLRRSEYNNIAVDLSWKTELEIEYIKDRLSRLG